MQKVLIRGAMLGMSIEELISKLIILIICLPVHELAHAWTADRFGDDTPRINGRLTLNPLAHLDPFGSLLLLVAGFGWAKPVPVNPYALGRSSPLALMWVSLAGPMANFLMAVLGAIPMRILMANPGLLDNDQIYFLYGILQFFIYINLALMLFNLLPIAPLDGSKIAVAVLPESWGQVVERVSVYGPIILMAVIFGGQLLRLNILGWIINPVINNLFNLLIGV
jgi:Zn-dependent protease